MKKHTNAFKEQIKEMGRELDSIITYEDTALGGEELNAVTPSFQGSLLKSVMKQLDIDSNIEIPEKTILKYKFGVKVNGGYEYIDFGNYIVKTVEKQEDTNSYKITCYDKMLLAMVDYAKMPITYPINVRDYINAICEFLGLSFKNKNDTFVNYDKMIQNELYLDSDGNSLNYTFRDVLDELAQVTGSTICINEETDELEIRYIKDAYGKVNSASGETPLMLKDSIGKPLIELGIDGNSYQETSTQNENLFDEDYYRNATYTSYGSIKYTTLRIKGGRYLVFKASLKNGKTAQNGIYMYISDIPHNTTSEIIYAISNGNAITRSKTFVATDLYLNIIGDVDAVYENYNIMIATNDVAYKPFVPDKPSPDYPSKIETINETIGIKLYGKNLFNINGNVNDYFENVALMRGNNIVENNILTTSANTAESRGRGFRLSVREGDIVRFSAKCIDTGTGSRGVLNIVTNNATQKLINVSLNETKTNIYIVPIEVSEVICTFITEKGKNAKFTDIVITINNEDVSFEPYTEKIDYINLKGNEALSGDKIFVDGKGNVKLIKNWRKVVLNGSEDWLQYKNWLYTIIDDCELSPETSTVIPNLISNNFTICSFSSLALNPNSTMSSNQIGDREDQRGVSLYVNDYFKTSNELKTWLSTHNTTVYYKLEEPQIIPLGAIEPIETFDGTTYIDLLSNLNTNIAVTYPIEIETINEDFLKNVNVNFGEKYGPINSIVISRSGESDNVYLQDEESVTKNGLHELKIVDNQIMNFNNRDEFLPDILNKLNGLEYYINDFSSTGITYYNLCDKYNVKIDDNIYSCVMLNDEINITQGLEENIYTEMPEESKTDYKASSKTDKMINQAYILVNKQEKRIDAVISEVEENSTSIANLKMTSDAISSEVSKQTTSIDELGKTISSIQKTFQEQTDSAITTWFEASGIEGTLNDLQTALENNSEEIDGYKTYIREGVITDTSSEFYGNAYIELGANTNQTKIRILPERIQFLTNDIETAYISNNTLYINETTVLTRQKIGKENIGEWVTELDDIGNLNTHWVD